MAVPPKPASTLVMMRDRNNGSFQPEVLMVGGNPNSLGGPGAFVYPGGVLESRGCSQGVWPLSPHPTPEDAAAQIADDSPRDQALGLFMAAIRETFEETLVLLDGPKAATGPEAQCLSTEEILGVRERLAEGSGDFFQVACVGQPSPLYRKPDMFRPLDCAGSHSSSLFDSFLPGRSHPEGSGDS